MKKILQLLTLTTLLTTSLSAAPIHDAAEDGNLAEVRRLLDAGVDVNARDHNGWTPLHWAAWNGRTKIVQPLINRGARVDVQDNTGQTPLHVAAWWGHIEIVRLLIGTGASVNAQDNAGLTPLHWVARWGRTKIEQLLIDNGARVDIQDNVGNTPLHWAANNGLTETAQLLIDNGARVDIQNNAGNTPLHMAANNGLTETAQLLKTILYLKKSLWNAARNNHLATAKKALLKGAQPNTIEPDSQTGDTPMHIAVWNNNIEMVKLLLKFGGKANIKNDAGKTAMDLVFEKGEFYTILPIFLGAAIVETTAKPEDRQDRINRLHGLLAALPKQQPCQLSTEQKAVLDEFRNSLGIVND